MIGGIKYRFQCRVFESVVHGQLLSISAGLCCGKEKEINVD